ncbi:MAG: 4-hydroxy-tetrahydrodipicolinate synthase [Clostridia bacterium]|nr:4-hydroxy-tetrahydrodipicolinate synthase [Clostridia bacterium]
MKTPVFTGSAVALITPFTENGVDYPKLAELVEYHIANKTDAIVVCGTTGEPSTMPDPEHKAVMKFVIEKVAKRIPVIAGTGSNDTAHAIELSTYAEEIGADAVLFVAPYYNKTTQKGLIAHTEAVAKSIKIPMILYNIPGRTGGLGFSIETLKTLSKLPNIVGVKEASGDLAFAARVAEETNLALYAGNDDIIVPILSIGGQGVISVVANIMPEETHNICQKFFDGDVNGSKDDFLKILKLVRSLFIEVNPIPIKTAMNLMDFKVGPLRMPLCDMTEENLATLKSVLAEYGLLK